jgi:hypothetical protein
LPVLDLSGCYGRPFAAYFLLLPVMHAPRDCDAALRYRWGVIAQALQRAETDSQRLVSADAWKLLMRDVRRVVTGRNGLHKANVAANVLPYVLLTGEDVDKALKAIATEMRSMGKTGRSHATLEHAWSRFRSVAHIWAAFRELGLSPTLKPLLVDEMLNMFSVAEVFRCKGMAYATGNQRRPLLDPDATWSFRFPEGTVLTPEEYIPALSSLPAQARS